MAAVPSGPKREKNWSLKATYVEIYNEQLRDLLIPDHVPAHERGSVTIREDVKGNIILTGLRQIEINSVEDLMNALNFGSTLRQTDATAINARSSRSHAVFSLNLVQRTRKLPTAQENKRFSMPVEGLTGSETWVTTDSKLHFVDLAGSERLKNTGAQGDRAKEGISINAGLAALGKVISQLSSRQAGSHVSYRDSKLTRLLQDSLGGNAITYMIACVTPPEFHLSETLNTVQYAQRARAIQSKPRIQQVEEGDKQAIIDRLKAEVTFLREQIRSAERGGGERRTLAAGERSERQNEREAELQNQLLDVQENYTTLSQRHAKLIAEMAKARDNENSENQHLEDALSESATERLNRSNNFAQAVEEVVLEYEKTIQSLEQSLSSTRATLANTETSLLEKESKCAYAETISTQLQARLTKLMDREASTENYLHDLESKLDGHTSGEEKNATIIMELRKEIARVRENEAACEDYISTLEERLAEADQDAELMQREIDRLEQVIERQRSLGKLDSLLYELDHIQQDVKPEAEVEPMNGTSHRRMNGRVLADHSRSQSHVSRHSHKEDAIPESDEEDIEGAEEDGAASHPGTDENGSCSAITPKASRAHLGDAPELPEHPTSPAQTKFVNDKLETVTQELLGLKVEHEHTLTEFDLLAAKYEEALRTLAELQDVVDEAKHPRRQRDSVLSVSSPNQTRPQSFMSETTRDGGRLSSLRSLSTELSSAIESPSAMLDSASEAETTVPNSETHDPSADEHSTNDGLEAELCRLKSIAAAKEAAERELAEKYTQLAMQHQDTLDMVEELKTEVAKAQSANVEASSSRSSTPVIRRKSGQNVMIIDRAHRSFASLRNIAAESFEGQPDVMQNFELNLNAAMHELHARSERIQELEADVAAAKREMETKMTIISGLTRERSSLRASPTDMAVVSSLRQELEMSEKQFQMMQEAHALRERELEAQLEELRETLKQTPTAVNGHAEEGVASAGPDIPHQQEATEPKIAELTAELANWESKHQAVLESMSSTEEEMKKTIEQLEAQVTELSKSEDKSSTGEAAQVQVSNTKQENLIGMLRNEIDEYKAIINSNATKVNEIEQQHNEMKASLESATRDRDMTKSELETHKALVRDLEDQIAKHEETIRNHQANLQVIHANHLQQVDELAANHESALNELMAKHIKEVRDLEDQHTEMIDQIQTHHSAEYDVVKANLKHEHQVQLTKALSDHEEVRQALEAELMEVREDLMKVATQVAFALGLDVSMEKLSKRIDDLVSDQKELAQEQKKRAELQNHVSDLTSINDTVMKDLEEVRAALRELAGDSDSKAPTASLSEQLSVVTKKVKDLENRNTKNSRLVEELEDQLQHNFDQVQMTNNRLSTLQTERTQQLEEANAARNRLQAELDALKEEYNSLQVRFKCITCLAHPSDQSQAKLEAAEGLQHQNSNSASSPLHKTASVSSLPSPPPAIPLPPIPRNSTSPPNAPGHPASPTPTGRPASKNLAQIKDDQMAQIEAMSRNLDAERQLTMTLEEALTDLEEQQKKMKADLDAWRRRASDLEAENKELKQKPPQQDPRWSLQAVEEERKKRRDAELAREQLEHRMNALNKQQKKKKGSLNCF
jgi:kinesin family protein 4/21/27